MRELFLTSSHPHRNKPLATPGGQFTIQRQWRPLEESGSSPKMNPLWSSRVIQMLCL